MREKDELIQIVINFTDFFKYSKTAQSRAATKHIHFGYFINYTNYIKCRVV